MLDVSDKQSPSERFHCQNNEDELNYEDIFSKNHRKLSKASTVDSGIIISKHQDDQNFNVHQCMLTKEIIDQTKPIFWNSTTHTLDDVSSQPDLNCDNKIEKIRQLLPEEYTKSFFGNKIHTKENLQEKFVVNLFECRKSLRIKENNTPKWPKVNGIKVIKETEAKVCSDLEDNTFVTAEDTVSVSFVTLIVLM